jgi:Ala-tRNA(Pro) deacylase
VTASQDVGTVASGRFGVDAVREYLDRHGWHYQVFAHKPTFRAVDEAFATAVQPEHEAKTIVLRGTGGYLLAVIPASQRLDLRKVRALTGRRDLRLATEREIASAFPVFEVGAVPPVGTMLSIPQVLDARLLRYSRIGCSAGDHEHALILIPVELERRVQPRVADLCED